MKKLLFILIVFCSCATQRNHYLIVSEMPLINRIEAKKIIEYNEGIESYADSITAIFRANLIESGGVLNFYVEYKNKK